MARNALADFDAGKTDRNPGRETTATKKGHSGRPLMEIWL